VRGVAVNMQDGNWTAFPNAVLDALMSFPMPHRCRRIVLYVGRRTYGDGNKPSAVTSSKRAATATGAKYRSTVSGDITWLVDHAVLIDENPPTPSDKQAGRARRLRINEDTGQWVAEATCRENADTSCRENADTY
jgi:hypothetical protein